MKRHTLRTDAEGAKSGRKSMSKKLLSVALNATVIAALVEAISAGAKWG